MASVLDRLGLAFDRAIAPFAPGWARRRIAARAHMHLLLRAHEAGVFDRLSPHRMVSRRGPVEDSRVNLEKMRAQARELYRRNPYGRGIVNSVVANLIGCGIRPQARVLMPRKLTPDESINDQIESEWKRWARGCDPQGTKSYYVLQAEVERELLVAGECLLRIGTPTDSRRLPLSLELISSERLSLKEDPKLQGGGKVVQGVEFDARGTIVAYHVHRAHPSDSTLVLGVDIERIQAAEVIHLFEQLEPDQVRGMTKFATIAGTIEAYMQWLDFVLTKERVVSAFAVMIKQSIHDINWPGTGDEADKTDSADNDLANLEGGMIWRGNPGESIEGVSSTAQPAAVDQLSVVFLRQIARGWDVSYELLSRDLSRVTYLSARQGENQDRRHWEPQQEVLNGRMNEPIWREFIRRAAAFGLLRLNADDERFMAVEFVRDGWDWIDPSKDVKGDIDAISAGLVSPQAAIIKRGGDPWETLNQIAQFKDWAESLGLMNLTIFQPPKAAAPVADGQSDAIIPQPA